MQPEHDILKKIKSSAPVDQLQLQMKNKLNLQLVTNCKDAQK